MPTYRFLNKDTNEEFNEFMSISECKQYLIDNPHLEQMVYGFPAIGYSTVTKKPDSGFRDVLKKIKSGSGRGNKIDTW